MGNKKANSNTNTKIQIQMVSNVDPLGIPATAELASNTEADTNALDTNVARGFIIYTIDICKRMKGAFFFCQHIFTVIKIFHWLVQVIACTEASTGKAKKMSDTGSHKKVTVFIKCLSVSVFVYCLCLCLCLCFLCLSLSLSVWSPIT